MIKGRDILERKLTNTMRAELAKRKKLRGWIDLAYKNYGVPEKISSDYITLRKNLVEASEFLLFILCDIVYEGKGLREFFTELEIGTYSKEKWHVTKAHFPLEFSMTKINDEQYIGKISVKELMRLKDSQLINYNENAQRPMTRIVRGETEYYQISLNKEAVYQIMDSFERDSYIPNTITLCLPEEAVYTYDEKENKLIIKKTPYFDILDGYHRYVALGKVCVEYPDFDYDMELRIVQFTEDKAKRFIWQEDQKTKMSKVDSEALDTTKLSNKIVDRINTSSCILAGQISRNEGIINSAYLSNAIDVVLLKGIPKKLELTMTKKITNDIIEAIEYITDKDPLTLNTRWPKKYIYTMIFEIKYGDLKDCSEDYRKLEEEKSIYAANLLNQYDITRTKKILGKEKANNGYQ